MNNQMRHQFFKAILSSMVLLGQGIFLPWKLVASPSGSIELRLRVDLGPPAAVSDLTALTGSAEGQLNLSWTAVGNDGMLFGRPLSYQVRNSTGGNINNAADWSTAAIHIANLSPTVDPGQSETLLVGGLVPGLTYYWAISARDQFSISPTTWSRSSGVNQKNFAAALDLPPAQVQGVTAIAGDVQVNLSWTDLTASEKTGDFDFYRIYRSTNFNLSQQSAVATTTSSSYMDVTVTNGVTYYYRVVGVDKGVTSVPPFVGDALESLSWSTVTARPLPTIPFAPINLQGVTLTTNSITWQWQNNAANMDQGGFNLYATTGGLLAQLSSSPAVGATIQYREENLLPNTSYSVNIKAFNLAGESTGSAKLSTFTLANLPLNLSASTATTNSVTLSWSTNTNPAGTKYVLERATFPLASFIQIAEVTSAPVNATGLAEFTTYTFRLSAKNGNGLLSNSVQIDTNTTLVKPGKINSLAASPGAFEASVRLQWVAPGNDGTSGDIASGQYDIRWSTNNITSNADFDLIPQTTIYQKLVTTNTVVGSQQGILLTGLNFPNMTLFFAIRARDGVPGNFSDISNVVSSLVQVDITSPSATNNLSAILLSSTSARLTWKAPGDDGDVNNNSFGAYQIKYATFPLNDLATFLQPQVRSVEDFAAIPSPPAPVGTQETMVLSGLALDTTYYFALRTRDEVPNYSPLSNGATVQTPDLIPPSAVQNLKAVANTAAGKRIDLSWVNPTAKDLRGIRILVKTDGFAALPTDTTGVTKFDLFASSPLTTPPTSFAHTNLTVGVTYYYTVFAFDDEANPNYSDPAFASTQPVKTQLAPPSRPQNVRGTRSGDGQSFAISWDSVSTRLNGEPLEPLELSSYTIFRMTLLNSGTNQIFSVPASSHPAFTDDTLSGRVLFYKVRAVNIGGTESEDSDLLSSDVDGTVMVMMDDGVSFLAVPGDLKLSLDSQNLVLKGTRDFSQEGGKTFKAMNVEVRDRLTGEPKKGYLFDKPVQVAIGYFVDASGKVSNNASAAPAFAQALPAAADAPKAFSIYWYNGAQWLKLGTNVDPANNNARVKSRQTGAYQLRLVQQALSTQMNAAFPRTITPNGDGINDIVFFLFENPTDAPVKGTIYDLKSAKVAAAKKIDIIEGNNTVLSWDGKDDSGAVVTGGVYLYKIEIGDKTFTGTVAVAR